MRAGIVASVLLVACTTNTIETSISFDRTARCEAPGGTMNTYAITLFATHDRLLGQACDDCIDSNACQSVAKVCACSADLFPSTSELEAAVQGVRFGNVDPDLEYCVRIVGFKAATAPATLGPCTCPPEVQGSLLATAQVCALSQVGAVNSAGADFLIDKFACRGGMKNYFPGCVSTP